MQLRILIVVLISAFALQQVSALQCWSCSDNLFPFCGEHIDENALTPEQKNQVYSECTLPHPPPGFTTVCMKIQATVLGKTRWERTCEYQSKSAQYGQCELASNAQYTSCMTCSIDGCNA